jgi:3-methyladenine DNA glycosylase AlkC
MADKLKDMFFTDTFVEQLGTAIVRTYPNFDAERFKEHVFESVWRNLELKQKMRHVTLCLNETLPEYPQALNILLTISKQFSGFDALVFSDFVECFGLERRDISLPALVQFTKLCSSEFAIRPFLIQDLHDTLAHMLRWAEDEDPAVRRLASEGCRPRLPWGIALPELKKNPQPIIPILEKLKNDPSETVRRSVANNLNDISKDHPQTVLEICERWSGISKDTDRLIKHACRGLLKAGNRRAMLLFGFEDPAHIQINELKLNKSKIRLGEELHFSFNLSIQSDHASKIRLEYIVYFLKARGNMSPKIFQIREFIYDPGIHKIERKHLFQDHSTRTHYPGEHMISIIVNGEEKAKQSFTLQK